MEIWQYILIAIGILAVIAAVYYLIKRLTKDIEKVHHLPIREKGFTEMPAVPFIISETIDTVVKLGLRTQECKMAKAGLNREYTLYDAKREHTYTQNAYTFMYDTAPIDNSKEEREDLLERLKRSTEKEFLNKTLLNTHLKRAEFAKHQDKNETFTSLFLDTPEDFTISWTNYYNIYKNNAKEYKDEYASILKDPKEATKQFWPMISENGLAYNLLILQKVEGDLLEKVKTTFHHEWKSLLKPIHEDDVLFAIDLTIFNRFDAAQVAGFDRWTPGAFVMMKQDIVSKKLHPICVQISKNDASASQIYTQENSTDATWIFALAAARTAVTVYGIWLGHVYHWHIVSAPMQMTLFNNVKKDHDLRRLLNPQSKSLIGFNDTLLLLWKAIGPPTSFATPDSFLDLTNTFATGREFFDDDPKVTLKKFGIHKKDFSEKEDWDRYPIVKHLLYFWEASEQMVDVFVENTYNTDEAVFHDTQLQKWIEASSDPEEGNVRGLPVMSSRKELKAVLTSLVYRVVAHGNSRQMRSLGPGLSFVANYPPCLQKTDVVVPDDTNFTKKDVLRYLPNTGTIGSMMTFYYIFIFSAPYEPLLPLYGNDTDLYFDDKDDPRNKALEVFREKIGSFILDYSDENAPLIHQWSASIET
ncbi:lipoxygenase family protein [uncultured Dokdonia sp.]|uniref:lipoxygenase family protein n=1 Tax=uncultured Dokdonia sp. TaxID=575653 RepID=UPI0026358732|nr:lipoxygenase family protein [uncultured Dokdonia sp.]